MVLSDITEGLLETITAVSHDPDEQDFYEVFEYIEQLPNTVRTLKELAVYLHAEFL